MHNFSFSIVKEALSASEKDRIIAIHFATDNGAVSLSLPSLPLTWALPSNPYLLPQYRHVLTELQIDWVKATGDYGAASIDSMKVSYRNIIKKLEKACAAGDDEPTAVTPARSSGGKKRKATAGDDETPKPKRGRKPKKADTPVVGKFGPVVIG